MFRRIVRAVHEPERDAGVGMILVIGLSLFMMILVGVMMTIVQNSLRGSSRHNLFDAALTSAESGTDQTLSRLQRAYTLYGSDYDTPSTGSTVDPNPVCNAAAIQAPSSFASASAEQTWAATQIDALAASTPSCIQHSQNGDYLAIKPIGRQTVYSMGWSPSYGAHNAKARLIKSEYIFAPYAPSDAILTGCNLEVDSSTTVTTVPNSDPTLAAVHSNCTITTQGNPIATGPVSSTGVSNATSTKFTDNPGGKVTNTAAESVPTVTASEVYAQNEAQYPNNWYDLCTDGSVRAPSSSGPCTGARYTTLTSGGNTWRGFQFQGTTSGVASWTITGAAGDGIYYFNHANVTVGNGIGNPFSNAVTLIASSIDPTVCAKQGGNIQWDHDDFAAPYLTNLFMFADADLETDSNFYAGGVNSNGTVDAGMFIAGDQINMQTSSQGAYGSVIAEDTCQGGGPVTSDVVKNPSIYYDPNASAPFTNIIDTTLWLEYVVGTS